MVCIDHASQEGPPPNFCLSVTCRLLYGEGVFHKEYHSAERLPYLKANGRSAVQAFPDPCHAVSRFITVSVKIRHRTPSYPHTLREELQAIYTNLPILIKQFVGYGNAGSEERPVFWAVTPYSLETAQRMVSWFLGLGRV